MTILPTRITHRKITLVMFGIAVASLAVFLHFRDDGAPPPCPFPTPPRDEPAERRYADAVAEFKRATAGRVTRDMDAYETDLSTERLAILGFEPAKRDLAESAKHLPDAERLLSLRVLKFSPPTPADMSPGQAEAVRNATRILCAAAVHAFRENRQEDAITLLETFGAHRLDTARCELNFIGGMSVNAAVADVRRCAMQLAYADTDPARIRRLLSLAESARPSGDLYRQSLIGEYKFLTLALGNLSQFGYQDCPTLLRKLPAAKSPKEAVDTLKMAWFALNTLPNATCRNHAEIITMAAATPESSPLQLPKYSFFECNLGRNCGGIRLYSTIGFNHAMLRDHLGRKAAALTDLDRIAIAIRLYALAHGKRPDTLSALAPDILPAVPNDPYDGNPVRYDAAKGLLWCLGKDLKDDGGTDNTDVTLWLPGCEPPDAESVFDQERRFKSAAETPPAPSPAPPLPQP